MTGIETVLIAGVPSVLTMILTNWFNRKKYSAEVTNLVTQGKSTEVTNMQIILETYKLTLEQYKKEIEDVNTRFTEYIIAANAREEKSRSQMKKLEERVKIKNDKIDVLEKKLNVLVKEACLTNGCDKRTYFEGKIV